jgi:hypothetical protein
MLPDSPDWRLSFIVSEKPFPNKVDQYHGQYTYGRKKYFLF